MYQFAGSYLLSRQRLYLKVMYDRVQIKNSKSEINMYLKKQNKQHRTSV